MPSPDPLATSLLIQHSTWLVSEQQGHPADSHSTSSFIGSSGAVSAELQSNPCMSDLGRGFFWHRCSTLHLQLLNFKRLVRSFSPAYCVSPEWQPYCPEESTIQPHLIPPAKVLRVCSIPTEHVIDTDVEHEQHQTALLPVHLALLTSTSSVSPAGNATPEHFL